MRTVYIVVILLLFITHNDYSSAKETNSEKHTSIKYRFLITNALNWLNLGGDTDVLFNYNYGGGGMIFINRFNFAFKHSKFTPRNIRYHLRINSTGRTIFSEKDYGQTVPILNYGGGVEFYYNKFYFGFDVGGTHTFNMPYYDDFIQRNILYNGALIRFRVGFHSNEYIRPLKIYLDIQPSIGANDKKIFAFGIQAGPGIMIWLDKQYFSIDFSMRFGTMIFFDQVATSQALIVSPNLNLRFTV